MEFTEPPEVVQSRLQRVKAFSDDSGRKSFRKLLIANTVFFGLIFAFLFLPDIRAGHFSPQKSDLIVACIVFLGLPAMAYISIGSWQEKMRGAFGAQTLTLGQDDFTIRIGKRTIQQPYSAMEGYYFMTVDDGPVLYRFVTFVGRRKGGGGAVVMPNTVREQNLRAALAGKLHELPEETGLMRHIAAAQKGSAASQFGVGSYYMLDTPVRNAVEAAFWLSLAANGGGEGAAAPRDEALRRLSAAQKREVERRVKEWRPQK